MDLQITSTIECFMTHITKIWTLPSIHMFYYLQATGFSEYFIYTQCSIMDAPQYVLADEPSDFPVFHTFCNTLHRDTDAPQYVQVHVPSGYLCY